MSPQAQQSPATTEIGWLGLFNSDLVEWLENENLLAPKVHVVRLWTGPSNTAASAGSLVVIATPGKGLRAFFVSTKGGAATEFQPDLFDGDWGYGPYFHETFLERRGTWFRLPAEPFPRGTWINAADLGGEPELRLLGIEEIVSSPVGDVVVLGIERTVLRARPEQDADMWCQTGDPPPLRTWQELRIPVNELYTPTGHLRLHKKYTRGC